MEEGSQCSTSERRKRLWITPASFLVSSSPLAVLCSPQEMDTPICLHALNGIIFLLKGLWAGFSDHWFVGAMVAWMIIAGFDVWYIEKSQRYRKK